ncbi:uncharacterized protein IUM83_18350 [Phytophthora cinnamomi]|uniref:uncharacterized protein n=1 Tax=Phytophthora cinnamomi TaxID=4785 RepID=UPI00355A46AF|nr:hypothetical protein IUM83_18350 [Phytophthora cinnamomi]
MAGWRVLCCQAADRRRVLDDALNDVLDDLVTVSMVDGVPLVLLEDGVLRLDSDNVKAKGCCWTKASAGRGAAAGELRGSRQKLMAMLVKQLRCVYCIDSMF